MDFSDADSRVPDPVNNRNTTLASIRREGLSTIELHFITVPFSRPFSRRASPFFPFPISVTLALLFAEGTAKSAGSTRGEKRGGRVSCLSNWTSGFFNAAVILKLQTNTKM